MIQLKSLLLVADNSGAKKVVCIKVFGGSRARYARLGDKVKVAVKEALPTSKITKGSVQMGVVVRQKAWYKRKDGSLIRFDNNSVVLIDAQGEPIGTRVLGPVARELRAKNYMKIISLAPEVL